MQYKRTDKLQTVPKIDDGIKKQIRSQVNKEEKIGRRKKLTCVIESRARNRIGRDRWNAQRRLGFGCGRRKREEEEGQKEERGRGFLCLVRFNVLVVLYLLGSSKAIMRKFFRHAGGEPLTTPFQGTHFLSFSTLNLTLPPPLFFISFLFFFSPCFVFIFHRLI